MNPRRRRPEARERGFTLIELLVAISLMAIATTLITVMVVTVSRTFTRQEAEQYSSRVATVGMQQISRIVRGGTEVPQSSTWQPLAAFDSARTNSLTVHTYLDASTTASGPVRINLSVNAAGELIETRTLPRAVGTGWSYVGQPSQSSVVVRDVAPAGTRVAGAVAPSMFTYLRADGSPFVLSSTAQLTETQRREVVAVRVSLVIQTADAAVAEPAHLVNTIALPNLNATRSGP